MNRDFGDRDDGDTSAAAALPLRVVRGEPTQQELHALLLALHAERRQASLTQPVASRWTDRSPLLRNFPPAGRRGWRSSAGANV